MADESWWPSAELALIFRHVVISVALAAGVWVVGQAVAYFVPEVRDIVDLIEEVTFLGILLILCIKLLWGFIRGNGVHALAAA